MQETKISNIIKVRAEFIDLIGYLEKINIDYVDINELVGFIYMDPKNEFRYQISNIKNNKEVYTFQYVYQNNTFEDIPNAIFIPNTLYDFDIDLDNKTFKKLDEFKTVEHTIINIKENIENNKNNLSFIRKILGC